MPYTSALQVIKTWLEAVNSRDLDRVVGLYASTSVLLPTFSPHTLRTVDARHKYFEQLASRPGLVVSLHDKTVQVQGVSEGVEVISGIYRFQIEIDEEPLVFEARFSYLIDLRLPRPILHHHSSQIPRTLS